MRRTSGGISTNKAQERVTRGQLNRIFFQAAVLLIACAAAWPLFREAGLLNTRGGGDSPFLLQRLHQLTTALAGGHFPVRWMPDANYGFGYPFYNFYAPLSIYVAALFRFLGFSLVGAIKLAQLAGFWLAALAIYHLARRWLGSDWAGLLAAAAYSLAPFHMVNVYVRGDSLAEFWAMALYPLVLLAADELVSRPGRPTILLLALSFAALILSHNISALIFTPFLLLYLLLAVWRRQGRRWQLRRPVVLAGAAALGLGLVLSAWFWLPALGETGLAQTGPVTAGYFHYGNHFLANPVQGSLLFNYDVAGREAFHMGLVQAGLALAGLLVLLGQAWRRRSITPAGLFTSAVLLLATFMLSPLSRPVWDHLPLLPYTQFPWRFLSVQALAAALLTGALAWLPGRVLLVPAGVLVLLVSGLGNLTTDFLPLTDADVTAEHLAAYEWFSGNIGSTVSAEYLPPTVQPRPQTGPWLSGGQRDVAVVLRGAGLARLQTRQATRQSWQLAVSDPAGANFMLPTLYWPGWQARLDGAPFPLAAAPGSGLMLLDGVPAGDHTLTLQLGRTPLRLAAELLSLAGVLGLLGWLIVTRSRPGRGLAGWAVGLAASAGVLAIAAHLWPAPAHDAGTLTWDFAQMAYLHHAPQGILFDDGSRLRQYAYSAETVAPGDTLTVNLAWDLPAGAAAGEAVTLALATPAVNRVDHAPLLVAQTQPRAADQMAFALTIPANAPAGLYVPRLVLANSLPLMPSGQARGDLFLRPLRVAGPAGGSPAGELATALQVRVDNVAVQGVVPQPQPAGWRPQSPFGCNAPGTAEGQLRLELAWLTPQPLPGNLNVSLRLVDPAGVTLAQCDSQPGYGFQPSSGWPAGQWVPDWLGLPLPPQLPGRGPLALTVQLYDVASSEVRLTRRLGTLDWVAGGLQFLPQTASFTLPAGLTPVGAVFGEAIVLHGYTLLPEAADWRLTLYWGALVPGREDYVRFAHLIDPATGEIVTQQDGMPQYGSYPTGQWAAGEVVADEVLLALPAGVNPAGDFQLAVGLYRQDAAYTRLPVVDAQGQPLPDGRLFLVR